MTSQDRDLAGSYYSAYEQHSAILRTWLVAYGVGAPVLVLTNEKVWELLRHSGDSRFIAGCFLLGVVLQVVMAALNKVLMWSSYYAEEDAGYAATRRYALTEVLRGQFWIDFLIDVLAILLFVTATYRMFLVLAG
jgi:hypothetical protein